MLKRQHGGGGEKCHLLVVHHRLESRAHRHLGLAVADVAAQKAVHRRGRLHVALDVGNGVRLVEREIPLKGVVKLPLPMRVGAERVAGNRFARGVQFEELFGHVAHGLLDARLCPFPRCAAELVERWLRGAAVFLDEVEPLDRHEQLVFAGVSQLHELLHGVADAYLLETHKLADAVIHMNHEVFNLQIPQVRQERLRDGPMAIAFALGLGALLFEDVGFGNNLKLSAGETKALRQLADRDVDRNVQQLVGTIDQHTAKAVLFEHLGGALGPPFRTGDKQYRVAALAHALQFGDPFLDAAAEFNGRLAWNVECPVRGLADRQLVDSRGARQFRDDILPGDEQFGRRRCLRVFLAGLLKTCRDLLGEPGRLRGHFLFFENDEREVAIVGKVVEKGRRARFLGQRDNRRLIERLDRSLCRWIVPADGFDVVADELDTDRIVGTGRKVIDDAATDAEFAVLVDRIFARKAGIGQEIAERDRIEIETVPNLNRGRLEIGRRAETRHQGGGRGPHNPRTPARNPVQGRCPLGRHAEVGRQAAVGIDLQRGKRLDGFLERCGRCTLERRHEESGIDAKPIDVLIGRDHDDRHGIPAIAGLHRHEERLGGRRQPPDMRGGRIHSRPRRGGLEQGLKVEGRRSRHSYVVSSWTVSFQLSQTLSTLPRRRP